MTLKEWKAIEGSLIVKTDRRSERKGNPIGFQTMNNILDHYPDV